MAAALIGALAALITPLIKDLFVQHLNEKRTRSQSQREIFRNYAAPLISSSEKLVWRFSEIFLDSRHQFLKVTTLPLVYNEYKRKSTLYRIASILGWIRAVNLELSALPRGASGFLTPISDAIGKLQSALADGPHVEVHRLKQICAVWHLDVGSLSDDEKKSLATRLEVKLYELAGDQLKEDSDHLKNLDDPGKRDICEELAKFLCDKLHRTNIDSRIVDETINRAIAALSYREALIYRDWQDAIGDAMLELDPDSVRRFKIVGYERFEAILKEQSLWIEVFRHSIDDIDFESVDPNDFRAKQLRDLAVAVSQVLICFSQTDQRDLVGAKALAVAKSLSMTA